MQNQDWPRDQEAKVGFANEGPGVPEWWQNENSPFGRYDDNRPEMRNMWQSGQGGAQAGANAAGGRFLGARGNMERGLGYYEDLMNNPENSVAQQQLKAGMEQNLAGQVQAQAAARGGNIAGAQQAAGTQAAGLGAQMNQQAAGLRAQEYANAVGGYSGLAGQMAGLDLQQQMGLGELGLGYGQLGADWELGIREQMEQEKQNRWDRGMGVADMAIGGMGGLFGAMGMSDIRAKQDIMPSDAAYLTGATLTEEEAAALNQQMPEIPEGSLYYAGQSAEEHDRKRAEVLRALAEEDARVRGGGTVAQQVGQLPTYTYEHKPGMGSPGRKAGVMAQDLQQQPGLSGAVVETPRGLATDTGAIASAGLAASAEQQREIDSLKAEIEELRRGKAKGKDEESKPGDGIMGMLQGMQRGARGSGWGASSPTKG